MSKQKFYAFSGDINTGKVQRRQRFMKRMEHLRKDKAQRFSDVS